MALPINSDWERISVIYYDVNGNLVKDLNKNIKVASANGITYNFMNKPEKIVIEGKSTIQYTYDASGEKLKKTVDYSDGSKRITRYIAEFVYEEFIAAGGGGQGDVLQYVLHEEGRLKIITPHNAVNGIDYELSAGSSGVNNWPGGKQGVFEYFIKDHLGNTRMVLTEEVQKEFYLATIESSPSNLATTEEKLFGRVESNGEPGSSNELRKTRYDNINPATSPWPNKTDDYTRLTAAELEKDMGPNLILKVMAGDVVNSLVSYYYFANNAGGPAYNPVNAMTNALGGALTSNKANALSKNQEGLINSSLNGNIPLQNFLGGHNEAGTSPKAFLNIVFFDEQFKFIDRDLVTPDIGSGFIRVSAANSSNASMGLQKKAPKNGWVFIYLSNESNETVYFDNLNVSIVHGRIAEETHYYPFGLKINSISSRAFNKLQNKSGYQGDFSEEEEETGYNEFDLRMYDPQIGRWTAVDPFSEFESPYVGMANNPYNKVDPTGGGVDDYIKKGKKIFEVPFITSYEDFLETGWAELGYEYIGPSLDGYKAKLFWGKLKLYRWRTPFSDNSESWSQFRDDHLNPGETALYALQDNFISFSYARERSGLRKIVEYVPLVAPAINFGENIAKGNWGKALLNLGELGVDIFTFGTGSLAKSGIKEGLEVALKETAEEGLEKAFVKSTTKGRLGNQVTRGQIDEIATKLEQKGWTITGGGGRAPETYLKPLGKGRKGGSYTDLTATRGGKKIHINTVDTYKRTGKATKREATNAARIKTQLPAGEKLLLIKKRV